MSIFFDEERENFLFIRKIKLAIDIIIWSCYIIDMLRRKGMITMGYER